MTRVRLLLLTSLFLAPAASMAQCVADGGQFQSGSLNDNLCKHSNQLAQDCAGTPFAGNTPQAIYKITLGGSSDAVIKLASSSGFNPYLALFPAGTMCTGTTGCGSYEAVGKNNGDTIVLPATSGLPAGSYYLLVGDVTNSAVTCPSTNANYTLSLASGSFGAQLQSFVTIAKSLTGESISLDGTAEAGEQLTYTIQLQNSGGADATGFNLTDNVPANTTFVSASNGGALSGAQVNWTGLTIPASGSLSVTITVRVANPIPSGVTQILNVAYPTGSTAPACPSSDGACVVTPTQQPTASGADMAATAPGNLAGAVGSSLTVNSACTNTGPGAAANATCVISGAPSGAMTSCSPTSPQATLAVSAAINCTTTFTPASPGTISLVTTAHSDTTDPVASNNTATTTITVPTPATPPSVSVKKALTNGAVPIVAGETLSYTITLTNSGGTDATNYSVTDALPPNTSFVSASNGGIANASEVKWSGLTVPAGGTVAVTVTVAAASPLPAGVTQIVNVAYATGTTPPACPGTDPGCVVSAVFVGSPNVSIAKALTGESGSQAGRAEPGEQLIYTITLTNTGSANASNFSVSDALPANTSFVSASNGGALSGNIVQWSGLTIPTGEKLTLTIVVSVAAQIPDGVKAIVNVAYASGATPPPCPGTDPACVVTPVAGPNDPNATTVAAPALSAPGVALMLSALGLAAIRVRRSHV